MKNKWAWVFTGMMAAAVIALVAVWLPAALKKLGLFSCLLGAMVAFALWKLKAVFDGAHRAGEKWFVALLAGSAEALRIGESYRLHLEEQKRQLARQIEKLPGMLPALETELTERVKQGFPDFLAFRYSAISGHREQNFDTWILFVMFAVELLLACATAYFVYRYLLEQKQTPQTDRTVQNSP